MPEWYPGLLDSVGGRVTAGQAQAIAAVNQQLVATYWAIGKDLLERKTLQGWGAKVVLRLSADLQERIPGARGFSPRNLRYMKSFAEAWREFAMLQMPSATLPWSHHVLLIEQLHDETMRLWYASAAVENGWSRNVLAHQIQTRLYERSGQAVTNFSATMPPPDSDLAQQLIKDPYIFDFVAMTGKSRERELETQLVMYMSAVDDLQASPNGRRRLSIHCRKSSYPACPASKKSKRNSARTNLEIAMAHSNHGYW